MILHLLSVNMISQNWAPQCVIISQKKGSLNIVSNKEGK